MTQNGYFFQKEEQFCKNTTKKRPKPNQCIIMTQNGYCSKKIKKKM